MVIVSTGFVQVSGKYWGSRYVASMVIDLVYGDYIFFFFFQAEDGIRARNVTGVQTCALPISPVRSERRARSPLRRRSGPDELPRSATTRATSRRGRRRTRRADRRRARARHRARARRAAPRRSADRKSTRLNSSHVSISYAVFC